MNFATHQKKTQNRIFGEARRNGREATGIRNGAARALRRDGSVGLFTRCVVDAGKRPAADGRKSYGGHNLGTICVKGVVF